MKNGSGTVYDDVRKCVDEVIRYLGKEIVFAMPLALGKPIRLINELYRRAKEDPEINLKIISALALEKPPGSREEGSPLERAFRGTPDFDYLLDYRAGRKPDNVEIYEFYHKAGAYLDLPDAQQNYISSNYTHMARDCFGMGLNVFGQLASHREIDGRMMLSMGCNTDTGIEILEIFKKKRARGEKVIAIAEVNENMPFMYGDALTEPEAYDFILKGQNFDYELFGTLKEAIKPAEHMIGIYVSTLIKDGGTLQVGIGALGDAFASSLITRQKNNEVYREILRRTGTLERYGKLIAACGGSDPLKQGLYGSSEMFVDPFIPLYRNGILKRKVFESIPLMKLINENKLSADSIPEDIVETLIEMEAVNPVLTTKDFNFLTEFGILKQGLTLKDGAIVDGDGTRYDVDLNSRKNRLGIRKLIGNRMLKGQIILGAFFIGPRSFYRALKEMSEEERQQFGMSGVNKVNQLYGGEELRSLQRKDARFINAGMMANAYGGIVSEQIENGITVSGIGGQYNFVAMAHAIPGGRVIMMIRSTRNHGEKLQSNIVYSYGVCSVPRHLRDIIVTEYGIADVRGKPDREVIAEMINIADSRFQQQLLKEAKAARKLPPDYEIPPQYRQNYPERIASCLQPFLEGGYLKSHPFGTGLPEDEL